MQTPTELYREYLKNMAMSITVIKALRNSMADEKRIALAIKGMYKHECLMYLYMKNIRRNNAAF